MSLHMLRDGGGGTLIRLTPRTALIKAVFSVMYVQRPALQNDGGGGSTLTKARPMSFN